MEITINCGTVLRKQRTIDLDDFGEHTVTGASEEDKSRAIRIIWDTMNSRRFADDGHRNHDAVDMCIALHVLGYDPYRWLDAFCGAAKLEHNWFFDSDLHKFMEHVERVCGEGTWSTDYPKIWGPAGHEGRALDYVLD